MNTSVESMDRPYPNPKYAWYVLGVLILALVFSFLDRQIMSLLVVPIKRDMMLSDTQYGVLTGVAFSLFYATCGIPVARLGDRKSRRGIISIAISIWCLMTAVCGVVNNFGQFFLARMGVGVGEAGLTPQSSSILSDIFPRHKLAMVFALFNLGIPIAFGLSYILGGFLVDFLETLPDYTLPFIGHIYNWQLAFFIVGPPGLLVVALIMLTVKEPARRSIRQSTAGGAPVQHLPVREVVNFWLENKRTFITHHFGSALKGLLGAGTSMWMPAFFMRTYGWSVAQAGAWYGGLTIVFSPIGLVTGGLIAAALARRGYSDANMRVVSYASLCLIPFVVLFPLMPGPYLALLLIVGRIFVFGVGLGPTHAAIQMVCPNQMRAQIAAVYLMLTNLIGLGMGPFVVGALTDYVFHDEMMLRYSMTLAAVVLGPLSSGLLFFGLKSYGQSVVRAQAWAE